MTDLTLLLTAADAAHEHAQRELNNCPMRHRAKWTRLMTRAWEFSRFLELCREYHPDYQHR